MPDFIREHLTSQLFVSLHVMAIVIHIILGTVTLCIYAERKISAYIQDRIGPNRTGFDFGLPFLGFLKGFLGLGQALADGLKFFLKEDYRPTNVDKILFTLAPAIVIIPAFIGFMILPWGGVWDMPLMNLPLIGEIGGERVYVTGAYVNVGVIYLVAVASLGAYGITLGGWASNNKYSFLGGLRATAQMISYEIPLGLALLATLLVAGTFMPEGIVRWQVENGWLILAMPLAAVLFYVCTLAESNRAPFDNAEAEQELVGGYHTEYSSMRFALFFLAEYAHLVTGAAFFALFFLGGYHLPGPGIGHLTSPDTTTTLAVIAKFLVLFTKACLLVLLAMLIRWSLPRMRYDQIMQLGWQSMIPMGIVLLVVVSCMIYLDWISLPALLAANVAVFGVTIFIEPLLARLFGRATANRRIHLYGSRFMPVPGTPVITSPTNPMAVEDRPVQGTVSTS
ncbi:MAG: NADH-quinone oxidoreductase subunit H [Phycisphaerales bacterium]|nr:NADH-quinone oxidoreductase subunit H [Planctomycetota bacterium]MCH8509154.1 NADH-quinone oxidoreductase subunit H [Phycisphaerales bacterium]